MTFEPLHPMEGVDVFKDPGDRLIPKGVGNFIEDFVLVTKGIATPTRFCIWAAAVTLSSVLKRDAWVGKWYPDKFWVNLYVVLVAPPRWNAKSTVIDRFVDPILMDYTKYLPEDLQPRKYIKAFRSKATAEGIFSELAKPLEGYKTLPDGKRVKVTIPWSNGVMLMSELGTFLTTQKHNENLLQKITDLYSCKDKDDATTKGDGKQELQDVYVTLLGATTPEAVESILPEAVVSDGFLSRVNIVNGLKIIRKWSVPYEVVEDGINHLKKRLAWIASHKMGPFNLSPEALNAHEVTNRKLMDWCEKTNPKEANIKSRMDLHVLKLAMLIRASYYDDTTTVTLDDYKLAHAIVEDSYKDAFEVVASVGSTVDAKQTAQLAKYLEYKGQQGVERQELLRRFSSKRGNTGIPARQVTLLLSQLHQEGALTVMNDDKRSDRITEKTHERYIWVPES